MTDRETNRAGYLAHISRWSRPAASARTRMWLRASAVLRILLQILFVPAIVLLGLLLALYLRLSLLRRPPPPHP